MSEGTHTYWEMTINNYDATDVALVQQAYPEHIRQLVYTFEVGAKTGTPHIQAYIRMKRDCRLSMMKKLFPRGSFRFLTTQEHKLNAQRYAQKLDETAASAAVITNWDPVHTLEGVIKKMVIRIREDEVLQEQPDLDICKTYIEKQMVIDDYRYAKIFVSSVYAQMWKKFGHEMFQSISHEVMREQEVVVPTHTHTHSDEKFSREGGITNAEEADDSSDGSSQDSQSEGDEECSSSETEAYDEGSDDERSEQDSQPEE